MSGETSSKKRTGRDGKWTILVLFLPALPILLLVLPLMSCGALDWAYQQNAKGRLPPSGKAPTSGPRIAYVCSEGMPTYTDHICVMRADGSGKALLTQDEGTSPVWSPDGSKIAYQGFIHQVIMVMNVDGSGQRQVADGVAPWWMADGKRISFIPTDSINGSVLISPDGEPKGESHWNVGHFPVAASPDGKRIAYEDGNYVAVKDVDGTSVKRLALGVAPWWLDAETIGFIRASRMVINADGSGGTAPAPDQASAFAIPPSPVSPDGKRIIFDDHSPLYMMNVDGSGKTRLAGGVNPVWSPDGKQVVFDDYGSIYLINADGGSMTRVGQGTNPVWSPQ